MLIFRKNALVLGLLCLALPLSASAAPGAGWAALVQSGPAAQAGFRAALQKNPVDADALCGLGLAQQQADDESAAVSTFRRFYAAAPASWQAAALWTQFTTLVQETGRWDLLKGAALDVLAAKNTLPSQRASARLALALTASRSGRAADAASQWNMLNYVRRWQIIGPFNNASQSGFDHAYPPEQQITLGGTCAGKDDQPLHWHTLRLVGLDGECAVGASLGDKEANAFYAVTAVQSPQAQPAVLEFDPAGASKISVNGVLVHADPIKRLQSELVADPFAVPVMLKLGWNTILIKLCDDENLDAAFALRVTTPGGATLSLPADPVQAKIAFVGASMPAPESALAPENTAALRVSLQTAAPAVETAVLLGEARRLSGDYSGSADALRKGLESAPNCGVLHWELSQTLAEDDQSDDARAERDLALKQDPSLVEAALDAVAEAKDKVSPAELVFRTRAVAAAHPASPDAQWALAEAYKEAKLNTETLATACRAVRLAPGSDSLTRFVNFLTDQNKDAEAAALLTRALKDAPGDVTLLSSRAEMLDDQDNAAAGIRVLQRMQALDPADRYYRSRLARLQQQAGQGPAAVRNLRIALMQRPQNADTCAALADALREQGHAAEAAALYRTAIGLDPSELTLRDKLAVLTGTKPVLDLAPETDEAPILAAAARLKAEPDASAVLLLDEGRTVVYPDFATLTRYHEIVKLLDQSAVQRYSEFPLSDPTSTSEATVESARVFKADGKVQDITEDAGQTSITFPSLSPGDLLDVSYRVEDYHRGGLARQFWSAWTFSNLETPSRLSRYVLITPAGLTFTAKNHGSIPNPAVHDSGLWRVHEWRMTDVPAGPAEIMGTSASDSGTWLDISTIASWAQIVNWYEGLSAPRCLPDAVVRAKAEELTKTAKTDNEKVQAIQAYVAREVEYQSSPFRLSAYVPTEGKEVIRERYGDCKDKAALLSALLAAVGLKSDMVLLSGRRYGLTPYLPSPRFNHAIARVQTPQGPLFVDATASQLDFGDLPSDDQQVPALVIAPATTALTETPVLPAESALSQEVYTDTLDADGTLHGTFDWTLTGRVGWQVRSVFREVPESKHEEMMRRLANYLIKDAVCDSDSIENAAEPDQPLQLHFSCHADHYSTSAGSFLLLPLPWSGEGKDASVTALLAEPKRAGDLEAAESCGVTRSVAHIRLPAGYAPQEIPADVHQETRFGSFRMHYEMAGDVLTATREVKLTALRVSAQDVPSYAAFLKKIDDEVTQQLVLKKM